MLLASWVTKPSKLRAQLLLASIGLSACIFETTPAPNPVLTRETSAVAIDGAGITYEPIEPELTPAVREQPISRATNFAALTNQEVYDALARFSTEEGWKFLNLGTNPNLLRQFGSNFSSTRQAGRSPSLRDCSSQNTCTYKIEIVTGALVAESYRSGGNDRQGCDHRVTKIWPHRGLSVEVTGRRQMDKRCAWEAMSSQVEADVEELARKITMELDAP